MAKSPSKKLNTAPPDFGRVQARGSEMLQALRDSKEWLNQESAESRTVQERIAREQTDVANDRKDLLELRDDVEGKFTQLAAATKEIETYRAGAEELRQRIDEQSRSIAAGQQQLDRLRAQLEEQARANSARADEIMQRDAELEMARQRLNEESQSVHAMNEEMQSRTDELERREEEVQASVGDVASRREALGTLQNQLVREQKDLAGQRQELLDRLDTVPVRAGRTEKTSDADAVAVEGQSAELLQSGPAPKPAGNSAAEQFRKLRRDSRRKAVGV